MLCIHVGQHQTYKYKIIFQKCLCCWWTVTHICERLKTNANTNRDRNTDTNTVTVIQIVFSQMLQRLKSQDNPSMSPWMLYPAGGLSGEHQIKTSSLMPISSHCLYHIVPGLLRTGQRHIFSAVVVFAKFFSQKFSRSNKSTHYSDQILLTKN